MIKVKFLADYRGVLTGELFYKAGEIVEFDVHAAEKLVEAGRAKYLPEKPKLEIKLKAKKAKKKKSKKVKK